MRNVTKFYPPISFTTENYGTSVVGVNNSTDWHTVLCSLASDLTDSATVGVRLAHINDNGFEHPADGGWVTFILIGY